MSDPAVPICIHTAVNGKRCQLVAMRGRKFCYFHDEAERRRRASARITRRLANRARRTINLPVLEDANAIQLALMETMHALIDQRLDRHDAGLLFYALQTASANVKSLNLSSKDPGATHIAWLMTQKKKLDAEIAEYNSWQNNERWYIKNELREEVRKEVVDEEKRKAATAAAMEKGRAAEEALFARLNPHLQPKAGTDRQ